MQRLFITGALQSAREEPLAEAPVAAPPLRLDASINPVLDAVRGAEPFQLVIYRGVSLELDDDAEAAIVQATCAAAEKLDYDFALKMQGLLGADLRSVWQCPTPEGTAEDRKHLMEHFVRQYVDQFLYNQVPSETPAAEDIAAEAVRQYNEFNKKWAMSHSRCLSPLVTASAESLLTCYAEELNKRVHSPHATLMPSDWGMLLRRSAAFSAPFATALAAFMNSKELQRGHRNASYKAMSVSASTNLRAQQDFGDFLSANVGRLQDIVRERVKDAAMIDPLLVDWYDIVRQLTLPPAAFTEYAEARMGAPSGGRRTWY